MSTDALADAVLYGTGFSVGGEHVPLKRILNMPKELPLYACHKKVRALEIRAIGHYAPDAAGKLRREIHFKDAGFPSIWVEGELFTRYVPLPGDFYVVYEDGYTSFSPRKAFMEGYSLVETSSPDQPE
jgi:hypothetical protein